MDTGDADKGLKCKEGKKQPLSGLPGDQQRASQKTNGIEECTINNWGGT
jgi:hypothetical protein